MLVLFTASCVAAAWCKELILLHASHRMFIGPVLVLAVLVARCVRPTRSERDDKPELKPEYDLGWEQGMGSH